MGGVISSPAARHSPPSSPASSPQRARSLIIDPSVIDLTTPPPSSALGKRRARPINYDDTYVDDDGTVHEPPDERPRKRRAPAPSSAKGKGKAGEPAPPKPKSILPPVRKVQPPPLPEPHRARLSALTSARPQGIVSAFLFFPNFLLLTMLLAILPVHAVRCPTRDHMRLPGLEQAVRALR